MTTSTTKKTRHLEPKHFFRQNISWPKDRFRKWSENFARQWHYYSNSWCTLLYVSRLSQCCFRKKKCFGQNMLWPNNSWGTQNLFQHKILCPWPCLPHTNQAKALFCQKVLLAKERLAPRSKLKTRLLAARVFWSRNVVSAKKNTFWITKLFFVQNTSWWNEESDAQ